MKIMDIIKKLEQERSELYGELIGMAQDNDYDLEEISAINDEIEEIDLKIVKINTKRIPCLRLLLK